MKKDKEIQILPSEVIDYIAKSTVIMKGWVTNDEVKEKVIKHGERLLEEYDE